MDRFFPSGRELAGGEALNTASQLAGWGLSVALVGTTLGDDAEGRRLRELITAGGLERTYIPDHPAAVTPLCEITVAPDGERTMRGRGFAEALAPPVPVELLQNQPVVAVDPNLGEGAIAMARAALAAGCPLVAMDFFRPLDIVTKATILQCSPESLGRFGGPKGSPEEIVHALAAPTCILTEGAVGGLVKEAAGLWRYPAHPLLDILDTTGAGDAFRAGLCYGLVQCWPLKRTVAFASAAAACHCRRLGGSSQIPLEEIQALLSKNS
nr:carbohydrate kinase family protein [Armatimonas rosea]